MQCLGKVVAAPVVVQRQVPGGPDSAELFGGAVVDVLVTGSDEFQQFTAQLVQKTVDFPQVQFLDKVLDVPLLCTDWYGGPDSAENRLEVPLLQFVHQVVDFPVVAKRHIPMVQKF